MRYGLRVVGASAVCALACASCSTPESYYAWGAAGAVAGTSMLASMPGHEMDQVYYLGVVDPQDQLQPTIYRVTVRGQASGISKMRFASGWVRAELVDSLNTSVGFDQNDAATTSGQPLSTGNELTKGRRLLLFGPEGFREAPKDHRLIVVMGASPEKFFQAVDSALGEISQVKVEQANSQARELLAAKYAELRRERERLRDAEDLVESVKGGA